MSPALALPTPGRPFDAATILQAMRTSPRPDGVPDRLETGEIAASVAAAIWTFDGAPWTTLVLGGTCGTATCNLEAAGTRPGAAGEDLWVLEIDPASGAVQVVTAELRAIPADALPALDAAARAVADAAALEGMELATVTWQAPPGPARFRLSYRSGGEEGSCAGEIVLDGETGELVEESYTGC